MVIVILIIVMFYVWLSYMVVDRSIKISDGDKVRDGDYILAFGVVFGAYVAYKLVEIYKSN